MVLNKIRYYSGESGFLIFNIGKSFLDKLGYR